MEKNKKKKNKKTRPKRSRKASANISSAASNHVARTGVDVPRRRWERVLFFIRRGERNVRLNQVDLRSQRPPGELIEKQKKRGPATNVRHPAGSPIERKRR